MVWVAFFAAVASLLPPVRITSTRSLTGQSRQLVQFAVGKARYDLQVLALVIAESFKLAESPP
jgi:hypothetical protein